LGLEIWAIADPMRNDYGDIVDSKNVCEPIGKKAVAVIDGMEVFVRKCKTHRERREANLACWATLFAYMTGFAACRLGGHLQQFAVFNSNPFLTVVVMLLTVLLVHGLFQVAKEARRRAAVAKIENNERDYIVQEHMEEAEINSAGLALSFLAAQATRFWLTGTLPMENGEEYPEVIHTQGNILSLYGAGLLLGISAVALPIMVVPPYTAKQDRLRRFVDTLQIQGLMTCAWCFYFATRYAILRSRALDPFGGPRSMGGRTVTALGLALLVVVATFSLGPIESAAKSADGDPKRVRRQLRSVISAFGILVGYSLVFSFEGAVAAVAGLSPPHSGMLKLMLAAMLSLVIILGWRLYVVEKVMMYNRMLREDAEARQASGYEQLRLDFDD